jgi:hypothetical protein
MKKILFIALLFVAGFTFGQSDTIVKWTFPNNPDDSLMDGGLPFNSNSIISTQGGTSAITYASTGVTTYCARATSWNNGTDIKYWQVFFATTNHSGLKLSSKQRSSDTGPRDFKVQYRLSALDAWTDVPSASVLDSNDWTHGVLTDIDLPTACDNQDSVFLCWVMTSGVSADGTTVAAGGSSRIDNIIITGVNNAVPIHMGITSVNGGTYPYVNTGFYAVVKSLDVIGSPAPVASNVDYTISLASGTGVLGGTLTGTILAGTSVDTVFGITYNTAESNVSITATDNASSLQAGTSALFNVLDLPAAADRVVIVDINSGADPYINQAFTATIETWNNTSTPVNVTSDVNITLSVISGTGTLGGTITGTIAAGTSSVTITGITYDVAENNVILMATDDALVLMDGTSPQFNVLDAPSVVITEIMYNPPETGTDSLEFIELYNNGASDVSLNGYFFSTGVIYTFPDTTLTPGTFFIVCGDSVAFTNFYGELACPWTSGTTSNNGEAIVLRDAAGAIIDSVYYLPSSPWPTAANGLGSSLVLCDPSSDNSLAANWSASSAINGIDYGLLNTYEVYANPDTLCYANVIIDVTPPTVIDAFATSLTDVKVVFDEAVNTTAEITGNYTGLTSISTATRNISLDTVTLALSVPLTDGVVYTLIISNVEDTSANPMAAPQSFDIWFNGSVENIVITEINYNDPSASVDSLEFIELYNNGASTANISGYKFTTGITFEFPLNTTINASSYLVIAKNTTAVNNFYSITGTLQWDAGQSLSNTSEKITLINMIGDIIDSLTYMDSSPWPTTADGGGPSLTFCDPALDNSIAANWAASTEFVDSLTNATATVAVYGTPGSGCVTTDIVNHEAYVDIVNCFPNPANDFIEISTGNNLAQIEIFDVLGNKVFATQNTESHVRVNTTGFSRGIYFVKITVNNTTISRKISIE